MKKMLVRVSALLFIATAAVISFIIVNSKDIPPMDDSYLDVEREEIPAEDNAYTYFCAATNVLVTAADGLLHLPDATNALDAAEVRLLLQQNEEMFKNLDKGFECAQYQEPVATSITSYTPLSLSSLHIASLLANQSAIEQQQGNYSVAIGSCEKMLHLGDLITKGAESVIQNGSGTAVIRLGLHRSLSLVQDKNAPTASLSQLAATLRTIGPFKDDWIRALKRENIVQKDSLKSITENMEIILKAREPSKLNHYNFQPNRCHKMFLEVLDEALKNAALPYAERNMFLMDERMKDVGATNLWNSIRPNHEGRSYMASGLLIDNDTLTSQTRLKTQLAETQILCALRLYTESNGEMPNTLDQLVPEYLPTVPEDPFDSQPYRYNGKVIYSVGPDVIDQGGSSEYVGSPSFYERIKGEDIVFKIQ